VDAATFADVNGSETSLPMVGSQEALELVSTDAEKLHQDFEGGSASKASFATGRAEVHRNSTVLPDV
jgi:hypothetical protein